MRAEKYNVRGGGQQFKPVVTNEEMSEIQSDGTTGFCLSCGQETSGVEPDARKYTCPGCGAPKVYGMEELLLMGLLTIRPLEEDK